MRAGSAPPSMIEPGGVIPGTHYRALRPLGRDSGSASYEVEHLELGRRFVLKLLRVELALRRQLVRRARLDWQALGKLRHPNIARVTDAGVTQYGLPYFVMEHLSGETLRQRLVRRRSLTVPEALAIAVDISTALAAAHSIAVVHRNVRPETIFLPADGPAKLLDFGIGGLDGADAYRAPEQTLGRSPDSRSDLYGVGLVVFEMVAGRAVFRSPVSGRPRRVPALRPLAEVAPGVARPLSDLVARLLAPEPDARPSLADEVVWELRRIEQRYEHQVSTTQATAHYATARLPFLVDTASLPGEFEIIVPMPSQTLEGIPWTVAAEVEAPKLEPRTSAGSGAELARRLTPAPALVAGESHAPGVSDDRAGSKLELPRGRSAPRPGMRLLLVMSCSLLGGVSVASLARRGMSGHADAPQASACRCPSESRSDASNRTRNVRGTDPSGVSGGIARSGKSSTAPALGHDAGAGAD